MPGSALRRALGSRKSVVQNANGGSRAVPEPSPEYMEVTIVDELVQLVSQRAGIPAETAATAVETVLSFLKERLPGPIATQIDGVIGDTRSQEARRACGEVWED